jgi:mannosyltransferase
MSVETFPVTPERAPAKPDGPRPSRFMPQRRSLPLTRATALTILAGLTLASLFLRLRGLHTFYWIDEGLSVGIASHPLRHIPSLLRQDGSPPLYYLLLHVWMGVRGHGEAATHELSLLFALLTIPASYWAASSLFDRRTGLICALLAAGAPYLSAYAEETRMYALLALLATIVAAAFLHAFVYRRRRYLPIFAISLAACLYTHNWSLFLGLASVVAFGICLWRAPQTERRALLLDGAIAYGAVALMYAPWLPTLVYQAQHTGAPWDLPPVIWSLTQGTYSLVGGRGAAVAILLAGGSGLLALRTLGPAQRRIQVAAISLLTLGFGTLLVAWAYSKITPAWADRYLAVIVGALILAWGLGLARAGRLGLVALALVACFWTLDPVPTARVAKSNVAWIAAGARAKLGSGALVLSTQPEQVPTIAYYLPMVRRFGTPLGPTPDPHVVDWRDALARLKGGSVRATLMPMVDSLPVGQRVLLVVPVNFPTSPLWMRLIKRDSDRWTRALERSPSMRLVKMVSRGIYSAGVPVRGYLFVKRA